MCGEGFKVSCLLEMNSSSCLCSSAVCFDVGVNMHKERNEFPETQEIRFQHTFLDAKPKTSHVFCMMSCEVPLVT